MSDENKEKLSEELEDDLADKVREALDGSGNETQNNTEVSFGDDWTWDAAVPETKTDNITFEDLGASLEKQSESVEEKAEEAEPEEEEAEETAEAAEENEPEEEKPADSNDDGCCIVCGKPRNDSPSDLYCSECREKFLRTDYGVGHILLAFIMVLVAVVGYFVCASTLPLAPKIAKAKDYIAEKKYEDAMNLCSEINDDTATVNAGINAVFSAVSKNSYTEKTWLDSGKAAENITLESYANVVTAMDPNFIGLVEAAFTDGSGAFNHDLLNNSKYDTIRKAYDFDKELYTLGNEYNESLSEFYNYDENSNMTIDFDRAMAHLDGIDAKTPAEKCMKDYYRAAVILYTEKNENEVFTYLDSLLENAGEFDYMFYPHYIEAANRIKDYDRVISMAEKGIKLNVNDMYSYYYIIDAFMSKNNIDSADKYCEEMKKNNSDATEYYSLKAEILRRQGKLEDAVKVCTDGIAVEENSEIYRQQAIAYMLLENTAKAAEAAKQAYDVELLNVNSGMTESASLDVVNTAALISFLCNGAEDETYKGIMSIMNEQGITLDEKVQSCIKGDIEFSEIFMEGDFDLV